MLLDVYKRQLLLCTTVSRHAIFFSLLNSKRKLSPFIMYDFRYGTMPPVDVYKRQSFYGYVNGWREKVFYRGADASGHRDADYVVALGLAG